MVIDQSYKITNPVTEVLNSPSTSPPNNEVEICSEISDSNDFESQPSQFSSSNITTSIMNIATTLILNTAATPKHHSDNKLLEDNPT